MNKRTIIIVCVCVLLLIIIITVPCVLLLNNEFCQLEFKDDLTEAHPLILQLNENKFIAPNKNGIYLRKGETVRLVCSGDKNQFKIIDVKEMQATCVTANKFTTNIIKLGEIYFQDLNCTQIPESIALQSGNKCLKDKTEIEIGFETYAGVVLLYKTCFDQTKKNSLYSTFSLSTNVNVMQSYNRPEFKDGDFYKDVIADVSKVYSNQLNVFKTLLGDAAEKYFNNNQNKYDKGHLTANADFSYNSQKQATFYYMNVAPQWMNFNSGNWKLLEENVRSYAIKQYQDLVVYTGVYGQVELPDVNNTLKELYLYSKDVKTYLTVPKIFWKLVYNPFNQLATVFVGHNNVYETKLERFCTDICDKINWLTWDSNNVTLGITYCCDYYEFQNKLQLLPDLLVYGFLG